MKYNEDDDKSEFGGDCMRKIAVMTVTLVLMLSFVGCTDKTISYNSNLGLDLNGIDYESVEFNVYHSNTQDHKWELLKTFSCSLKVGHFSDIRVEGEKNQDFLRPHHMNYPFLSH